MRTKRKRKNPIPAGLILGGGLAGITLGALIMAQPMRPRKATAPCGPYRYSENAVRSAIEDMISSGQQDFATVAVSVATQLFGQHPTGEIVTFPPGSKPLPGVQCVWDRVLASTARVFDGNGINPLDESDESASVEMPMPGGLGTDPWHGSGSSWAGPPPPLGSWSYNEGLFGQPENIRHVMRLLGYIVPVTNAAKFSTTERLWVRMFQRDYNAVSWVMAVQPGGAPEFWGNRQSYKSDEPLGTSIRGHMTVDGMPGPKFLNALERAYKLQRESGTPWRAIVTDAKQWE